MTDLLRLPAILQRTKISRSQIYFLMKQGDFPKPIRVGKRAVRWRITDIENWIESRPQGGSWFAEKTVPGKSNSRRSAHHNSNNHEY